MAGSQPILSARRGSAFRPPAKPGTHPAATDIREGSVITFDNVCKNFGSYPAVADVHLRVRRAEFLCIIGPSGCGKSTLLNLVSGLDRPSLGSVTCNGVEVAGPTTSVGYITQKDLLLPWRTVADNVRLPLELQRWKRNDAKERVREVLEMVGLGGAASAFPYQLSGGMRKRVSIARILAYSPQILLMDEPFGSLDAQLRLQMHEELLRIWSHEQNTVVFVTHDLSEAITLADRIVVMTGRPGRVAMEREIEISRPRNAVDVQSQPAYSRHFKELWEALGHRRL